MAIGYLSQDQSICDFLDKKWSITVLFYYNYVPIPVQDRFYIIICKVNHC